MLQEGSRDLHRLPRKPVKLHNAIIGQDHVVHPPDIIIDGTSGCELEFLKNLAQQKNPYGKKESDLRVVGDVSRLCQQFGRPVRDHSSILQETIDMNSSMVGSNGSRENLSSLRQRSISSLLKNSSANVSRKATRKGSSRNFSPEFRSPNSPKHDKALSVAESFKGPMAVGEGIIAAT